MIKLRVQGTKNNIRQFYEVLRNNPKVEVIQVSKIYSNKGTNKYFRWYIALKDVKYVGGTVVRYQREQTRSRWAKLKDVLDEDDILGNKSVEYFQEKWDELVEKYNY